jgi:amino acid permease
MSEDKEALDNAPDEEVARIGYEAALGLWTYQGTLNWNRFNVMLVANSIILAVVGISFTSQHPLPVFTILLPILGLVLCVAWFFLTVRGYDFQTYWALSARELEERYFANTIKTLARAGHFGQGMAVSIEIDGKTITQRTSIWSRLARSQKWISYLVIVVFMVLYAAILFQI